ncbi:hypothetical protein DVH05_010235 [Phytophthora capsici]|nr:hypothetical protein DVH05_010235 [Phytophthora capsici]
MARYPTEPSIQKYSAAASKQIALCSVRQSPTKRIKDTATEILREAESIENTPREPLPKKRTSRRPTNTGKRKSNSSTRYGAAANPPRGSAYNSSTSYRGTQGFSKSPYRQIPSGFGDDMNSYNYPVSAPQQPSSLVILDGGIGLESGFGSANKYRRLSKEDRQSELFDAYGIHEIPNGRPHGTKRAQLRAHLASAETTWATPQHRISSSMKPYSSRSERLDHGHGWDFDTEEHPFEAEPRQPRGGKRKKKNPSARTAFQVKLENENQLRVSREARPPYPSPQRLGAATKRAAKARHKRIAATGHSSLTGKSSSTSSESLNEYATQLFQDNASRGGTQFPARSRLTPREKEEIRERERLSFAEKLHKMIDKAKSTLASSNTMDPVPIPPKSSKPARKTAPDRTRTLANTPKQVEKEVLSSEVVETRPAKPTSRANKRNEPSSVPVVPRPKPTIARSVVTPKSTDARTQGNKTTKGVPTKTTEKARVEKPKEAVVMSTPAEAANTLKADEPHPAEAIEEVAVEEETKPTVPVEPEASSPDVAVEMEIEAIPLNATSELQAEPTPPKTQAVVSSDERRNEELPDVGAGVENAAMVKETETADTPISPPQAMEEDTTPELTTDAPSLLEETVDERQAPLEEPAASEPTVDLPSESSATVDAMYGDAFNDFDDNGGEDEDLTAETGADPDDTHTPATEASSPINNPMQESKSGEALYDDYDEFDEDEPPQDEDVEVEDTPVEDVAAEITALLSQTETEPDPVKNAPEGEEEAEAPAVADAAEDTASAFTGEEGANVDENGGGIDVEPLESELGPGQESQPEVSSNGQTTEEAPSDIEPIVGSAEDQESVNLDVDSAPVPSDENAEEGDPYSIPVDDPDKMPVDDVAESAPDGGTGEKPDGDVELDEVEVAAENDGASAQLESEASEPKLPGENEVSVGSTTIEATANPVQDEDARTDCTAQQDVPPMSDEAVTSLEQDGEAKKLTTDSSVASVHSVVYDDDNFDDEAHNEAGLSEAVDTSAVEETVQVAEPRQEDESPDTTPNPEPIPAVSTDPEDDSKTLVANSSELSVQSAGYDDDGFEDGAQEDPQADTSEDRVSVQEPSGNEHTDSTAVDTPLERASEDKPISPLEDEVPGATTEIPKDDDIENTAADETPKETAPGSVPEMVDVSSELKQPDPTTTSESEVVVAPSIEAENESPDSLAQDETTGNIQEPANVEAEKDEEAGQVDENAGGASEGDTVATTEPDETENIVTDPSAVPDTLEDETSETNATPAEDETSEIAIPTETVMAQTEAEAGEEPATYDDDNFADEEEVAPSVAHEEPDLVAKEAAGEGLKGEEPMIQSSEQPSVEIGESVAAVINNEENTGQEGNAGMEESSHPKQPEENVVDSSGGQDKPDDSVQGLTPEGAIPSENVEEAPAESEDVTSDVGDSVPAVKPSEVELTATPTEQPHDQNASVSPDDENPKTENSADTPQVESIPDPEVESDAHAYSNDSVTASPESAATTGEIKEETSAESEPHPDDIRSVADIPAEPLVADTQETEYDAEFDDAENDVALDATPPKNEPIQDESGTNEEATVEYEDAEFDDAERDATLAKDDKGPIQNEGDGKEVAAPEDNVNVTTKDEATGQPTDDLATETDTNASGAADVDDSTSANVNLEASNQADTEEETKKEADVDASQYEEDFPDAPPEIQDTEPISTKVEAPDSDNTATEPETIAIESIPDNDPFSPNENARELAQPGDDVVAVPDPPMDELYDDGFDDDNTALAIDPSDSSNPIETSSPVDGAPVVNGDSDGLDSNADAMQDEADVKVEESDAADTIEAQPTEALVLNEPIESETVKTETVEPVPMEPDTINAAPVEVEVNDSASMEPETAGTVPVEPPLEVGSAQMEPEASTSTVQTNEPGVVELEPDAHRDEVVKPEVESGKTDVVESEGVELGNTESQPPGPIEETLLSADSDGADPELVEPSPVESNSNAPAPKSQEEGKLADPSMDTPATLEAGEECFVSELSEIPIPIENSDTLPVVEVPAEAEQVAPNEGNDGTATGDAKEEASQEEKPSIEEIAGDPLQSDKPAEDTTDSSVEAPSTEAPVEVAADEQLEPVQSDAEHTLEAGPLSSEDAYLSDDNPDDALNLVDPVSQENQEVAVSMGDANKVNGDPTEAPEPTAAIVEPSNAAQRAIEDQGSDEPDYADDDETYEEQSPVQDKVSSQKDREVGAESPNDTAQVSENIAETSSEAIETPTPTEVIEPSHKEQPTVEDEASDEPDYAEDDVIEDESPVVVKDESNGSIGPLPPVSAVQGGVNVPELVIENESPEPDQTVAGSEAPKTEDQYDDDDGYNEFDDQEPPTVEVPAPSIATTKAPATEDEYDEYENDEYGEEEKPSKNEPEAVKSTRSSPPVSAREEEINEVADDPEEAEENAYADDQDEYEEDEVPAPVPQSSSPPKPDNAVPKQAEAEASADEYEDDNEEEDYADDEIEDSSPPKPAAAVHPAKSDDEMEEELESEEDYTSD